MASIQTASVSTLAYLQRKNKITYVSLVVLLSVFLLLDYIAGYSTWVTPPVALFLGLIFALSSGQAHPKFNKKVSKYLLQYSVAVRSVRSVSCEVTDTCSVLAWQCNL